VHNSFASVYPALYYFVVLVLVLHSHLYFCQVISEIVESCRSHDITDLILVHEHRGQPDGLIVSHLPHGPTAYFGLLNVVSVLIGYRFLKYIYSELALSTSVHNECPHLVVS
jgi:hypothetical protein